MLYRGNDGAPAIEVRLPGDTVCLSLNQLAAMRGRNKSTISRHIANGFADMELRRESVVAEFATTAVDGKTYMVEHVILDVIISVLRPVEWILTRRVVFNCHLPRYTLHGDHPVQAQEPGAPFQ